MEWIILFGGAIAAGIGWSLLARRKSEWHRSSAGNYTQTTLGSRVTVFQSDGGWKFCIADPSNRTEPHYSDPYDTEEEAKHEALALITGTGSQHSTKREKRNHSIREQSPDLLAAESARLDKLEQAVAKALLQPTPNRSTLEKIRTNARKRTSQSDHLESQLIRARADDVILDRIAVIRRRYWEIKWQMDELLDDPPSTTNQ